MALIDGLVSYWKLDEASGNALDAHSTNDLTETSGTIGSTTGKIGNCRDFEAGDTELFLRADNAALSITGDMTITAWVWLESTPADTMGIVAKWLATGNQRSYALFWNNATGLFTFFVSGNGTASTSITATTYGTVPTGQWIFVCARHDATADTISISVNAQSVPDSTAHTTGIFDSTAAFTIGRGASTSGSYWDGLIDEVGIWNRALADYEVRQLYNNGNGLAYPLNAINPWYYYAQQHIAAGAA